MAGELVEAAAAGDHDRTPVTAAAMNEHVDVVRALIEVGADVDLQDDDRGNPLAPTARSPTATA